MKRTSEPSQAAPLDVDAIKARATRMLALAEKLGSERRSAEERETLALCDRVRELETEKASIDQLRAKLIEVAGWNCPPCQVEDGPPVRDPDGRWWHEVDEYRDGEDVECDSYGIHEALYQFRAAPLAARPPVGAAAPDGQEARDG